MSDGFLLQGEKEKARHYFVMIPHYPSIIQLQRTDNPLMASSHISQAPPLPLTTLVAAHATVKMMSFQAGCC